MPTKKKKALHVKELLLEKGHCALETAKQIIKQEKMSGSPIQEALEYFMESWNDVVHPAFLALSCEAVGGNPEKTTQVGVGYILLAGGADIHDDVIDESLVKYSKKTVLGKFGKDIAVLAGDALLFKGLYILHEACEGLQIDQKHAVMESTMQAFFGISNAEAKESSLKSAGSIDPEEYMSMIKMKAAVAEATMKIGAIIGSGSPQEINALSSFGETIGVLLTIRDEFIDMFEVNELKNRAQREWLPLPILYALRDPIKKPEIMSLVKGRRITKEAIERTLDLVLDSKESRQLKDKMMSMIEEEIQKLSLIKSKRHEFILMLESTTEDL